MAQGALSDKEIRILDFDSSLLSQKKLLHKFSHPPYQARITALGDIAPYVRYWTKKKYIAELKKRIDSGLKNTITLYGSGDFHHVTGILLEGFPEPLSVISFDHHPDWDGLSFQLNCGSWVNHITKRVNIRKVLLLGPSSDDLSSRGLITASLSGLNNNKLEIYPYLHEPSRVFLKPLKDNVCLKVEPRLLGAEIQWSNLKEKDMNIFLSGLLERLPTDDVYITIDKDCLSRQAAFTNWEEGLLGLDWLLGALNIIKNKKNIVGLDITGEYSPVILKGLLKGFFSWADHPKENFLPEDTAAINAINESTNLKILDLFIR